MNGMDLSPPKKRTRKRISTDYQPPRTDEDLAKRFKEVCIPSLNLDLTPFPFLTWFNIHHRICKNTSNVGLKDLSSTSLGIIYRSISSSTLRLPWDIWLSLNPESDATAIWLERKFDMPDSGSWVSDSVFTIPLAPSKSPRAPGFPGMIVFECTPVGDVVDELEKYVFSSLLFPRQTHAFLCRKYRVLDDCSRLRDVISALPANRHFVPSLLIIHWAEEESSLLPRISRTWLVVLLSLRHSLTLLIMKAKQLESESIIQSYSCLFYDCSHEGTRSQTSKYPDFTSV
jgi:hypothetical protein